MPSWLSNAAAWSSTISAEQLLWRLLLAALCGGGVGLIYRWSHGRGKRDAGVLVTTLVLLAVLIAMVSLVIGESVARAFSLVGALSIVRFRTVVEDTRDTAFVIFAVVVGMAAGAGLWLVPLMGIPIVGGLALLLSLRWNGNGRPRAEDGVLSLRMAAGRDPEMQLNGVLRRHASDYWLSAVETAQKGTAVDLKYRVQLEPSASLTGLVAELSQTEGVQSVELKR